MQPSKEMKKVITGIAAKHGYTVWSEEPGTKLTALLNLGDTEYYPLVIEKLTETTVRVAHEYPDETGEIVADPAILFFIGYGEWVAMELHQPNGLVTALGLPETRLVGVELTADGRAVKGYDATRQKNITIFGKAWAKQLRAANWENLSKDADEYQQTSFDDRGEVVDMVRHLDRQLKRDGVKMTVSDGSGKHSATIGAR